MPCQGPPPPAGQPPRGCDRWKREAKHINASLEVLCRTLQRYPHGYLPARDGQGGALRRALKGTHVWMDLICLVRVSFQKKKSIVGII